MRGRNSSSVDGGDNDDDDGGGGSSIHLGPKKCKDENANAVDYTTTADLLIPIVNV